MRKLRFEDINKIVFNPETKRVISSNHPVFRKGYRIDERFAQNILKRGWVVCKQNGPLVENLSTEDLFNNVILANERDGRFSVFESPDGETAVYAQTQNKKVFVVSEYGEEKYFYSIEEFLKSIPGFILAGVVDETEL